MGRLREKVSNWLFAIGSVSIACALLPVNDSLIWVGVLVLIGAIFIAGSQFMFPWSARFLNKTQSDTNQDKESDNR